MCFDDLTYLYSSVSVTFCCSIPSSARSQVTEVSFYYVCGGKSRRRGCCASLYIASVSHLVLCCFMPSLVSSVDLLQLFPVCVVCIQPLSSAVLFLPLQLLQVHRTWISESQLDWCCYPYRKLSLCSALFLLPNQECQSAVSFVKRNWTCTLFTPLLPDNWHRQTL